MNSLFRKIAWWLRGSRKEDELREELRFHMEAEAREQREAGLSEDNARRAAQRSFGNEAQVRENVRAVWTWRPLDELAQDVRFALRTMATNRVISVFAVLSLALGIGANSAIFSYLHAVLLRPLPVSSPETLVALAWHSSPATRSGPGFVMRSTDGSIFRTEAGVEARIFPYAAFAALREPASAVLSHLFVTFRPGKLNVLIDGAAEMTEARFVSGNFFDGMLLVPQAGRLLIADDDRVSADRVAVLAAGYAERRFGSAHDAVGRSILIDNVPFTVAGVTADGFDGIEPGIATSVYLPLQALTLFDDTAAGKFTEPDYYWASIMGRLRPDVTLAQAQAVLAGPFHTWVASTATNEEQRANLPQLRVDDGSGGLDTLRRRYVNPLYLLQAIVLVILTLACANAANLLLARSAARQREIAVRLSVGAGRARLMRQLLTESLVLSVIGGGLGLGLAVGGMRLLNVMLAEGDTNLSMQAELNPSVVAVTLGLAVACGLLFGLAPAVQTTRPDLIAALKGTAGRGPGFGQPGRSPLTTQRMLLLGQLTLLLLLLVGAGSFTRTLVNLESIPLGFNADNVLLFEVNAPQAGVPPERVAAYYANLQERFGELPGVRSATHSHSSMLKAGRSHPVSIDGAPIEAGYRLMLAGPAFLSTMQIPLLAGRDIDARDRSRSVAAGIVSERFAAKYFPDQNPIGRRMNIDRGMRMQIEVVGIAAEARYGPLRRDVPPVLYVSYTQAPADAIGQMTFALRTDGDPLRYVEAVRRIVQSADSRVPVTNIKTQTAEVASTIN